MIQKKFISNLQSMLANGSLFIDQPLKDFTFTKTGGMAKILVIPNTYREVQEIMQYANRKSIPVTILGNGSNIIVKDNGIDGVVMMLTGLDKISAEGNTITAQSGAAIIDVSREALKRNLTGMEFACGIPGSVGGALYMNAGAYGGEISYVLDHTLVITTEGELKRLPAGSLNFNYRNSLFREEENFVALEAVFKLETRQYEDIKVKMDELTYLRESKQPLEYPSCGSVFKRPPGHYAGKLIQDAGLQGKRIGGAEVSGKHAGFIINVNHATATDYVNLITFIQQTVKQKFNVQLETEVEILDGNVKRRL